MTAEYIAVANVGDSRAYLLTRETMEQVTTDHTVVHMLMETGQITEEEMETHPKRHMLMKAVGGRTDSLSGFLPH